MHFWIENFHLGTLWFPGGVQMGSVNLDITCFFLLQIFAPCAFWLAMGWGSAPGRGGWGGPGGGQTPNPPLFPPMNLVLTSYRGKFAHTMASVLRKKFNGTFGRLSLNNSRDLFVVLSICNLIILVIQESFSVYSQHTLLGSDPQGGGDECRVQGS